MFIETGIILIIFRKEQTLMTTRVELKVDKAWEKWKKLIAQGWGRTKPVWEDS